MVLNILGRTPQGLSFGSGKACRRKRRDHRSLVIGVVEMLDRLVEVGMRGGRSGVLAS